MHYGTVGYDAEIWVNDGFVGSYWDGYTSFSVDASAVVQLRTNVITVCAEDATRWPIQASGKQSDQFPSQELPSTRVTGI